MPTEKCIGNLAELQLRVEDAVRARNSAMFQAAAMAEEEVEVFVQGNNEGIRRMKKLPAFERTSFFYDGNCREFYSSYRTYPLGGKLLPAVMPIRSWSEQWHVLAELMSKEAV